MLRVARGIKTALAVVTVLAFVGLFFGPPIFLVVSRFQLAPAVNAGLSGAGLGSAVAVLVFALTIMFGRIYCESLCPLGILQTVVARLFRPKNAVRRVCTRLPRDHVRLAVRWGVVGVLIFFGLLNAWGLFWSFEPYAICGRAAALYLPGVVMFAAILVSSLFGKGRIWCNWVCPVGAVLEALSWFSVFKGHTCSSCANCRACFDQRNRRLDDEERRDREMRRRRAEAAAAMAKEDAGDDRNDEVDPYSDDEDESSSVSRRTLFRGAAAFAVAEKLTDGGLATIVVPDRADREKPVLPPGAGKRNDFMRRCLACQLCVKHCPSGCLKPSVSLRSFGQPELDFRSGPCLTGCTICSQVCPAGALRPIPVAEKKNCHVGVAVWDPEVCLRKDGRENCTACIRKCPVAALEVVEGLIAVNRGRCIGCGACEHVCAARPKPAIHVEGFDEHQVFRPIGENDLLTEMRSLIRGGAAVVCARNGVIDGVERGGGIDPLMRLLDGGRLTGAIVTDRVIGRAAAAICIVGGVRRVDAMVMSEDAIALLDKHGVAHSAAQTVSRILNRDRTASCPMESRIDGVNDPKRMVELLKRK